MKGSTIPAHRKCEEPAREGWIRYWDEDEFWAASELWRVNAELFLRRADPLVHFRQSDSVLNVGCGPGYLERRLAPRVKSVWALDASERFVERARRNCRQLPNVAVRLLGRDYTDLAICDERFSVILCVSVVQYYRGIDEVESLIRSAQRIALPGARMLIADLPQEGGFFKTLRDAWGSFLLSVGEDYTPVLAAAAWSYFFGRGRGSRASAGRLKTLDFPVPQIRALVQRMDLKARIIPTSLSVHARRPSLFIEFP